MVAPVLIYHFQSSQSMNGDFRPANYKVIYFFDDQGFLDTSLLKEMSKSVSEADHEALLFQTLDDLKSFALRVCQELKASEVRIMSVQDYNIGLDGARDRAGVIAIFEKYGEVIINEDASAKKGFLSKFFN